MEDNPTCNKLNLVEQFLIDNRIYSIGRLVITTNNLIQIYKQIYKPSQSKRTGMKINNLLLLALCATLCMAEDQGDWVRTSDLPIGFTVHPFFAGYLPIGSQKQYYYVYHPSESNPSKDPLVVRVSAGPGCSSLYSWLYTKGPFVFVPETHDFRINPFNWNKEANVLFIEGPAGVGYSIDKSAVKKNMTDNDYADEMVDALYAFYAKFPELKDQDIYLTGEQYGGNTIPRMAKKIVQKNNDINTPSWQKIKLKGFLIENPCTLGDECDSHFEFTPYTMQFLKNHYYISKQKYHTYNERCGIFRDSPDCLNITHNIEAMFTNTGSDITNLYRECKQQTGPEKYKCMDTTGILAFMNNADVKKDIHVDASHEQWDLCNLDMMEKWKRDPLGTVHIYEQLLREERDLRIWIISGTLSASVPTIGTRKWVENLKLSLNRPTIRVWDAWKYNNEVNAGSYEEIRGMTFVSVRAAGSKIYRDQPEIGLHIYDSFIKGKAL